MALPSFLQPYLASYDLGRLDPDARGVRSEIINQVLNSGDDQAVKWLFRTYPLSEIEEALKSPKRGSWSEDSLSYWSRILKVNIDKEAYDRAILNLTPW